VKDLNDIKSVFFIGIGGIGMSALARFLNAQQVKVSGYDKTKTSLTKKLVQEGIEIHFEDNIALIPSDLDLIVWTPAIPKDHKQWNHLKNSGIPMMKRAELLGMLSKTMNTIAVAGTHGKTTTSTMAAYLAKKCGNDVSAFLGGISTDFGSNYLSGESGLMVVEADEYDRSFLHLSPTVSIINSMDADHLDIYGEVSMLHDSFNEFARKTRKGGSVIVKRNLKKFIAKETLVDFETRNVKLYYFGDEDADILYKNVRVENGKYFFDYQFGDLIINNVELGMPGIHNLENMTAALSAVYLAGVDIHNVKRFAAAFKGIKRRFELIVDGDKKYIDDYAHHPTELDATIESVRAMYPDKKILGIFQPHLYSRTNDFCNEFAASLDNLDEVILLPIYPARELPMAGVASEMITTKMKNKNVSIINFEDLIKELKNREFDVVLTLGAGDIDLHVEGIKEWLINER
jgi:UDP-N-acetylmuramate--alanine ligase